MGKSYSHIDLEERCRICAMRRLGHSLERIAAELGRSKSSIAGEAIQQIAGLYEI